MLTNGLEAGIYHISKSTFLLIGVENYTIQCDQEKAETFIGCQNCLITLKSKCSWSNERWWIPKSLTQTLNADHSVQKHVTNLGMLLKFFDEKRLEKIQGDTLLNSELQVKLPQIRLYEEKVQNAYVRDKKSAMQLNHVAEMVKSDKVILSSLSEALVSGEISLDNFWISTQGIILESTSILVGLLIANGIYLQYQQRKILITLALLKAHITKTEARNIIEKLDYFVTSTPGNENSKCRGQEIIIEMSNNIYPHLLTLIAILVIVYFIARRIYYKIYAKFCRIPKTTLALEFNMGRKSVLIKLCNINGQFEDFEGTAIDYIKNISIGGILRPEIHFKWPSFKITNIVTQYSYNLKGHYRLSWSDAWDMKEILRNPFVCFPVMIRGKKMYRLRVQQPAEDATPMERLDEPNTSTTEEDRGGICRINLGLPRMHSMRTPR